MKRHGVALAWRHLCKRSVTFFSFFWGGHTFIIVAEFFPGTFSDAYFKGRQAPSRCSGRDPSYSRSPHLLAHSLQLSHAGPLLSLSRPPPPPPPGQALPPKWQCWGPPSLEMASAPPASRGFKLSASRRSLSHPLQASGHGGTP